MCKKIIDILFPTNILGKKKKCVKFDLPDGYTAVTLNIQWEGERLDAAWTRYWLPPNINFPNGEPYRESFTDGDGSMETITVYRASRYGQRVGCHEVYFNCTNVTKLIVNGEQLI